MKYLIALGLVIAGTGALAPAASASSFLYSGINTNPGYSTGYGYSNISPYVYGGGYGNTNYAANMQNSFLYRGFWNGPASGRTYTHPFLYGGMGGWSGTGYGNAYQAQMANSFLYRGLY